MVNVMWMQIKMKMLIVTAKCGGSVTGDSDSIFLSNCFSISLLNPIRVFSMAFTSSTFAVTFAFAFVNNVISFSSFLTSTSLFSLLISLFEFILSYWL